MTKELQNIKEEFIKDRIKVIFQLHTDIMFYDMKAKKLGNDEELRKEKKELFDGLELDKEKKPRKTDDNETKISRIKEIDRKIDTIIKNEEAKVTQENQLRDFELYIDMVNSLDKDQVNELEEAVKKANG